MINALWAAQRNAPVLRLGDEGRGSAGRRAAAGPGAGSPGRERNAPRVRRERRLASDPPGAGCRPAA